MTVKTVYNEGTENEYTEERDYRKGEWVDSVVASEMYKYTVENGLVKDMDGNVMSLNVDWGVARPEEKIRNAGGSYYTALEELEK